LILALLRIFTATLCPVTTWVANFTYKQRQQPNKDYETGMRLVGPTKGCIKIECHDS
jgi:hypothetical protein